MNIFKSVFGLFLLIVFLIGSSFYLNFESYSLAFPNNRSHDAKQNFGLKETFLDNSEGNKMQILSNIDLQNFVFEPSPIAQNYQFVLYFHGNVGRSKNLIDAFTKRNTIIISPAYLGYHGSTGEPNFQNVNNNSLEIYNWLVNVKRIPESQISIMGFSLGGAPATYLAALKPKAQRLILINTFASLRSICSQIFWFLCNLMDDNFNSSQFARLVLIPVYQFQSDNDEIINVKQGKELFNNFWLTNNKNFWTLDSSTHNNFDFNFVLDKLKLSNSNQTTVFKQDVVGQE